MALTDSDPTIPPRPLPETTKSDEGRQVIGIDDLVPRERKRLGDYIALQTQQVFKNEYAINAGSELFNQKTPTGNPAPIVDTDTNAVNTYMNDVSSTDAGQTARSIFEATSDSGLLDTDTRFEIKKGKSDDNKKTGNEYLREIDRVGGQAEIPQRIQTVMLDNNRFAESNPAFVGGQTEGRGNSIGSLILQPNLGKHAPQRFPRHPGTEGGNFTSISIDKLKNFGLTTLLQASGEVNVPTDLNDPTLALGANATAATPGLARVGQRVPVTRFDGVKILNELDPGFSKQLRDTQLQGNAILSHGNVNSPLVPFAGLLNASSVASAQVLALTVAGMVRVLYEVLNALNEKDRITGINNIGDPSRSEARKLKLGNYKGKKDDTAVYRAYKNASVIDLVDTKVPYFKCVNKGIQVFFGTEGATQLAIAGNGNIQLSSGWYNTVFRNLLRNTGDMLSGLLQTANVIQRQAYDIDPNLGGTGAVSVDIATAAYGYITGINNSPILKFMNILALMGEAAFFNANSLTKNIDAINDQGTDADGAAAPKLGVLHMKNRLSDQFGNKLAWGSNTVKSMYLLPSVIKTAAERLDGNASRFAGFTPTRGFKGAESGRFSGEEVDRMEEYLEADYLPFYFHDLRTNEIISFHAFLDNISDNYTVDYTENEGYGRVGKVLTYKNTNRTISLGFAIVATNSDDFDDMWFKINKLITLLYPQYTQGRDLHFGDESFTQPFSQQPAASPMIRLRLGDIFKSNYNRFDLARVFGLANPGFSLGTTPPTPDQQRETDLMNARQNIRNRMERGEWQVGDVGTGNGIGTMLQSIRPDYDPARNPLVDLALATTINKELTVVQVEGVTFTGSWQRAIKVRINNPVGPDEEGEFLIEAPAITPLDSDIERQAQAQIGTSAATTETSDTDQDRQAIDNFFAGSGENANPIFKSFESVRGKGLAGFIRSFNMDIDKTVTWETVGINNRAPKLIRISMQFDPIHDLQPGLDSNGFNSGPVYNVGGLMKQATRKNQADLETRDTNYRTNTSINTGPNRR